MKITEDDNEWAKYVDYLISIRAGDLRRNGAFNYHWWNDVKQKVLIRVWNNRHRYKEERGHIKSFIKTIAYNTIFNAVRDEIVARNTRAERPFVIYDDGEIVPDCYDTTATNERTIEDFQNLLTEKELLCVKLALAGESKKYIRHRTRLSYQGLYSLFRRVRKIYFKV